MSSEGHQQAYEGGGQPPSEDESGPEQDNFLGAFSSVIPDRPESLSDSDVVEVPAPTGAPLKRFPPLPFGKGVKKPRELVFEEDDDEPDLAGYFDTFKDVSKKRRIAMCRGYASYLNASTIAKKRTKK